MRFEEYRGRIPANHSLKIELDFLARMVKEE